MAVNHLDDQQFQYLDDTLDEERSDFESHLNSCQECRQKLAEYREIYYVLREDTAPQLSANFSKSVLDRLQIKNTFWSLYNDYLLSGLAIFIAITGLMIWFSPWKLVKGMFASFVNQMSVFFTSLSPLLGGKIHLILGICLILIIIEVIDYKLLRPRLRQIN